MTTTVEAGGMRRPNRRSAPAVAEELRIDPAGAVHAFLHGSMWSRCHHHTRSLTTAIPSPRGPLCTACAISRKSRCP